MKLFKTQISLLLFSISGLLFAANDQSYDPNKDARIRLFGQNGKPTLMTSDINCETAPKGQKVNVGADWEMLLNHLRGHLQIKL